MTVLRAIETVYQGYRFRSRLEARWAVFFEALEVEWEYEPEGFDLPGVGNYLPDFRLPWLDCWIEIKPGYPSSAEALKAAVLAETSQCDVFIFCGSAFMPLTTDTSSDAVFRGTRVQHFHPERYDDEGDPCWDGWSECVECLTTASSPLPGPRLTPFVGLPGSRHWKRHEERSHPDWRDGEFKDRHGKPFPWIPELPGCNDTRRLMAAYKAARSARFEFAEHERV